MSFPVITKQGQIVVAGTAADVIISHFGNHLFLCVSHYHKLGSLMLVSKETVFSKHTYAIKTLLGSDNEMLQVLARAIAELVYNTSPPATAPTLLLALAIQDVSPTSVKETVTALEQFGIQPDNSNTLTQKIS